MSIDSNSVNPSIRVTPSVGDAPMLSSCITTSHPPKRFTTLITLLCTRGSTRRVFIREVTPHSSQPDGTDISGYFGVIKCKVVPPYGLYHPVLPFRHAGKLTFPLCAACVETEMAKPLLQRSAKCAHSDDERALTGTWCSPQLQTAVELGYRIDYIYEFLITKCK